MGQVFGLMGKKGSGKDTAAAFLMKAKGFKRASFAEKLYAEAAEAFGVTVEFLNNRLTKETPLPQLCLANCTDIAFVTCVQEELGMPNSTQALLEPLSPRVVLQLWGTEYRRVRGVDSYWVDIVEAVLKANPDDHFAISDVRFPNEYNFLKEKFNATMVRVVRPVQEAINASKQDATALHPSEVEAAKLKPDFELTNEEGNPDSLKQQIIQLYEQLEEVGEPA